METKTYWKELEPSSEDGEIYTGLSMQIDLGDEDSDYSKEVLSDMEIVVYDDGCIKIAEGDGLIIIDSGQLEHLQKAVEIAIKARDNG